MTESLEACNQKFLEGLQSLASKQEGGSASLLKISEIEVRVQMSGVSGLYISILSHSF